MRAHSSALTRGFTLAAGLTLVTAACSSGGGSGTHKSSSAGLSSCSTQGRANTCNSAATKSGGTFTYTLEKNIQQWNVRDTKGNTFENGEALGVVLPQVFVPSPTSVSRSTPIW
ncbi:hypothetical protein [Streptomyces sp. NBC_00996]|uniref:hypothetical protein n=1 Tax=Streptomyces sp. NBC_00996 TaxID=2903710 RepID=UPI00386E4336|nr:hypothetical protein OG390_06545 [Streptomyces sp. NBC_00996]